MTATYLCTMQVPNDNTGPAELSILTPTGKLERFFYHKYFSDAFDVRNAIEDRLIRAYPLVKNKLHGSRVLFEHTDGLSGSMIVVVAADYDS